MTITACTPATNVPDEVTNHVPAVIVVKDAVNVIMYRSITAARTVPAISAAPVYEYARLHRFDPSRAITGRTTAVNASDCVAYRAHDDLTSTANRIAVTARIEAILARLRRYGNRFPMMMPDPRQVTCAA